MNGGGVRDDGLGALTGEDVGGQVDVRGLVRQHAGGHGRGVDAGPQGRAGRYHDHGVTGQPVGVGDRVEHEPLGLAHREAQGVLAHLHVGVGGGQLEVPRRAIGVLVIVQHRDGDMAVGVDLVDGHVVVHAHRVGQGSVARDLDGDGAGVRTASSVGDGVGDRVVALLLRQVEHQAAGPGGHTQGRVAGDRVPLQGQAVAVGVQVIGQDVHGDGAPGLGHDQIIGGHRGHVER